MKKYRVTFELELSYKVAPPEIWLPSLVDKNLMTDIGENATNWKFEELTEEKAEEHWVEP